MIKATDWRTNEVQRALKYVKIPIAGDVVIFAGQVETDGGRTSISYQDEDGIVNHPVCRLEAVQADYTTLFTLYFPLPC